MEQGILETEEEYRERRHKQYLKGREQGKNWVNHKDKNGNIVKQKRKTLLDMSDDEKEKYKEMRHRAYLKARELNKPYVNNKKTSEISDVEKEKRKLRSAKWKAEHPEKVKKYMDSWHKKHYDEEKRSWQEYRRNNKKLAVEYLGGKCVKCEGVFHPDVYDFHHKNENEKDVCVGKLLTRKFERITPELDKCILLCANCHRVIHAQY